MAKTTHRGCRAKVHCIKKVLQISAPGTIGRLISRAFIIIRDISVRRASAHVVYAKSIFVAVHAVIHFWYLSVTIVNQIKLSFVICT